MTERNGAFAPFTATSGRRFNVGFPRLSGARMTGMDSRFCGNDGYGGNGGGYGIE